MKRSTKRLQLNIETVRSLQALDESKLQQIVGGAVGGTSGDNTGVKGPGNSGGLGCHSLH
jgi:hypothetical protein